MTNTNSPASAVAAEPGSYGNAAHPSPPSRATAKISVGDGPIETLPLYLQRIGQMALLEPEEEADLAKRLACSRAATTLLETPQPRSPEQRARLRTAERDGQRAIQHLVEANLRLVSRSLNAYAAVAWTWRTSSRKATSA